MAGDEFHDQDLTRRVLTPVNRVVPVIGAGVSQGAGLPDSEALAQRLIERGRFDDGRPVRPNLFDVVDALDPSWAAGHLTTTVIEQITERTPADDSMPRSLIDVPSRFLITLNYDLLIEQTARAAGRTPVTLTNTRKDLHEAHRILAHSPQPANLTVLHLHGAVTDPDTLVLENESYLEIKHNARVIAIIGELAVHHRMVFYGTSLNEGYLLERLSEQFNPSKHVLVCTEERDDLTGQRASISATRHHVHVTTVPAHADLPRHVHEFLLTPAPERTTGRITAGNLPAPRPYIGNDFADLRNPVDPQERIFALIADTAEEPVLITEQHVLDGHRTLVVGIVGTGKTDLLEHLAAEQRPDRPAVLIRLGDQRFTGGNPERVLAGWTSTSRSAQPNVDVSVEAIKTTSMHFLLDGLDEVPGSEQNDAADLIARIARRLPQHSFTVTSRPTAAVQRLGDDHDDDGRPVWAILALEPGQGWQRRYLQHRGVAYEDLLAVLPELQDMAEVLLTPFFLARIVDLHQAGRLAGHPDLGALLQALVDWQLEREETFLNLDRDQVRTWLEDIALAGLFAGRKSFDVAQLSAFALPRDAEGDQRQLAELLVQRLLLAEDAGIYRFTHRIFAEHLAAEALVSRPVTEAALDSLAPRRTSRVAGVRDDALLTVTLLCRRSEPWRTAIAERDSVTAAACIPDTAPSAQRQEAAQLLWDTYTDRGVWMWERGHSALLDHAQALGRLLGRESASPVAVEIRQAIRTGTAEQQGNAITAWARSRPSWLQDELSAVLNDGGRNGVVLRQAALAAINCRYVGLVDDLLRVLTVTRDSSVQQTVGFALVELMPEDRRLELGRAAMRTPEADLVLHRLASRWSPEELLLLAAEYVGEDVSWDRQMKRQLQTAVSQLDHNSAAGLIAAACQATVVWRLDEQPAAQLASVRPAVAAEGIAAALQVEDVYWYQAQDLAKRIDDDILLAAGIDEQTVGHFADARHADEIRRRTPPPAPNEDLRPVPAPRTLKELLADPGDQSDAELQHRYRTLAAEAATLAGGDRKLLIGRIERWRPEVPYAETITWLENRHWQQLWVPAAWVAYSAALDLPVDPDDWARIATSGVIFDSEQRWLRSQSDPDRQDRAARRLAASRDVDRWRSLLDCCENPLTELLMSSAAEALSPKPDGTASSTDEENVGGRALLIHRLVENDRPDLAWKMTQQRPELLDRTLAEHGDPGAQHRLVADLVASARSGQTLVHESFGWMASATDPQLLDSLFETLGLVYKTSYEPVPRYSSGVGLHDVINPLTSVIATIGGQQAVEGYDRLLDCGGDLRWLRRQRDEVAASVLRADGLDAAPAAAAASDVPVLAVSDD